MKRVVFIICIAMLVWACAPGEVDDDYVDEIPSDGSE